MAIRAPDRLRAGWTASRLVQSCQNFSQYPIMLIRVWSVPFAQFRRCLMEPPMHGIDIHSNMLRPKWSPSILLTTLKPLFVVKSTFSVILTTKQPSAKSPPAPKSDSSPQHSSMSIRVYLEIAEHACGVSSVSAAANNCFAAAAHGRSERGAAAALFSAASGFWRSAVDTRCLVEVPRK